jgi:methylthioribose-1-phosphate isomerase
MSKGDVDVVLVGSDRCAQNGDIINKVGTYPLALMAKEYGIPFYALVQDPGHLPTGRHVPIEERPVTELFNFQGRSITPEGVQGRYPAFDVTPAALLSNLISYDGVFTPDRFREKFQEDSVEKEIEKRRKKRLILLYGIPRNDDYNQLFEAFKDEQADGMLVPEARPQLWGVQEVARELIERGISTTLISDNMMGTFFAQEDIRRVYLFYHELDENGPVGICGSLLAARLAQVHGVPIKLLGSGETRQQPLDETVATFMGQRVCPEEVTIYPIEKDRIPWSLLKT